MALYKKAEFCKIYAIPQKNLTTYIQRGKIRLSGEFIDDSVYENNVFIQKRLQLIEEKQAKGIDPFEIKTKKSTISQKQDPEIEEKPETNKPGRPKLPAIKHEKLPAPKVKPPKPQNLRAPSAGSGEIMPEIQRKWEQEAEIREISLEKDRETLEILKIKREKLMGTVIPTDAVRSTIMQLSKAFSTECKNANESFLSIIAKEFGIPQERLAYFRGLSIEIINKATDSAIDTSISQVKNIVKEYSEKRGVGERD